MEGEEAEVGLHVLDPFEEGVEVAVPFRRLQDSFHIAFVVAADVATVEYDAFVDVADEPVALGGAAGTD